MEYLIQLALTGLAEVLNHKGFTEPKRVKEQLSAYEVENNPISGFMHLLGSIIRKREGERNATKGFVYVTASTLSRLTIRKIGVAHLEISEPQ